MKTVSLIRKSNSDQVTFLENQNQTYGSKVMWNFSETYFFPFISENIEMFVLIMPILYVLQCFTWSILGKYIFQAFPELYLFAKLLFKTIPKSVTKNHMFTTVLGITQALSQKSKYPKIS